jgi:hypothetical protein
MDKIPEEMGGDLYMVNGNMVPLKDAGAAYADKITEGGESGNG